METGDVLQERYELRDEVGRGGMAVVYRGFDRILEREVAVKFLAPERATEPGFMRRFLREARAAASLAHPNIVAIHDFGEESGEHYLVMELIDGQTLAGIIDAEGALEPERAVHIATQALAGLEAAHARGLVHRDVKPANIMVLADDHVKVADFGLARATADSTVTASVYGSAPYIAPEQARGERVDHRADIYAAGCVIYEMFTGEPPFSGDSALAVVAQHLHNDPPLPSSRRPGLAERCDEVVLRALAKSPEDRHQTATELLESLRGACLDEPRGASAHGLVAVTQVLGADGTTEILEPTGDAGRRRSWLPASALGLVALVGLGALALVAIRDPDPGPVDEDEATIVIDDNDAPEPEVEADEEEPATVADDTEESPAPTTPEAAVRDAALDVLELVEDAEAGDHLHRKVANELRKYIGEVIEEVRDDNWSDALDALEEARKKLNEGAAKGEVTPGWARRIHDQLDELEATLRATHPSPSPSPSPSPTRRGR